MGTSAKGRWKCSSEPVSHHYCPRYLLSLNPKSDSAAREKGMEFREVRENIQKESKNLQVFAMTDLSSPQWRESLSQTFQGGILHFADQLEKLELEVPFSTFTIFFLPNKDALCIFRPESPLIPWDLASSLTECPSRRFSS